MKTNSANSHLFSCLLEADSAKPQYIFLLSPQGIVKQVYANKVLYPLDISVFTGVNIFDKIDKKARKAFLKAYKQANYDQKPVPLEYSFNIDSNTYFYDASVYPPTAMVDDIIVVLNETTVKKRQEAELAEKAQAQTAFAERLKESTEKYKSLFDATCEGIVIHDDKGILDINLTFASMMQYELEELKVMSLLDVIATEEDKRKITRKILVKDTTPLQAKGLRKDGTYIEIEIITKRHTYEGRSVSLSALREISERKKAEVEVMCAQDLAEESLKVKEQFFSVMSHELRTPLNTVVGMAHLLLEENPQPEQVEYLQAIKFSADNLMALINDLLDFSKIESGKVVFENIDFNLRDLLKGIKQSLILIAEEKDLKVIIQLDIQVPEMVKGDMMRLNQILTNLISNAIKFTEAGYVVISVAIISEGDENLVLLFEIKDTGIGIPENKLDLIFESYQQASPDISRRFGGTGLGLTITKRLVELQGGTIRVQSKEGEGSVFTIILPFMKSADSSYAASASKLNKPEFKSLGHVKLLLVEDNKFNQLIASKFLTKWGIEADMVESGYEAIELLHQKQYDLVLMDLQMPEINGFETTKLIRSNPSKAISTVPIIAITAAVLSDVKARVLEAGMDDYISKPFNPSELYQKVSKYASKAVQGGIAELSISNPATDKAPKVLADFSYLEMLTDEQNEFIINALEMFLQHMTEFISGLEEAINNHDLELYKFHTHKMKSTYNTLGIYAYKELIRDSENGDIKHLNFESIRSKAQLLKKLNEKVRVEIEMKLKTLR
jgi:PAS domain S-box-containing protein